MLELSTCPKQLIAFGARRKAEDLVPLQKTEEAQPRKQPHSESALRTGAFEELPAFGEPRNDVVLAKVTDGIVKKLRQPFHEVLHGDRRRDPGHHFLWTLRICTHGRSNVRLSITP